MAEAHKSVPIVVEDDSGKLLFCSDFGEQINWNHELTLTSDIQVVGIISDSGDTLNFCAQYVIDFMNQRNPNTASVDGCKEMSGCPLKIFLTGNRLTACKEIAGILKFLDQQSKPSLDDGARKEKHMTPSESSSSDVEKDFTKLHTTFADNMHFWNLNESQFQRQVRIVYELLPSGGNISILLMTFKVDKILEQSRAKRFVRAASSYLIEIAGLPIENVILDLKSTAFLDSLEKLLASSNTNSLKAQPDWLQISPLEMYETVSDENSLKYLLRTRTDFSKPSAGLSADNQKATSNIFTLEDDLLCKMLETNEGPAANTTLPRKSAHKDLITKQKEVQEDINKESQSNDVLQSSVKLKPIRELPGENQALVQELVGVGEKSCNGDTIKLAVNECGTSNQGPLKPRYAKMGLETKDQTIGDAFEGKIILNIAGMEASRYQKEDTQQICSSGEKVTDENMILACLEDATALHKKFVRSVDDLISWQAVENLHKDLTQALLKGFEEITDNPIYTTKMQTSMENGFDYITEEKKNHFANKMSTSRKLYDIEKSNYISAMELCKDDEGSHVKINAHHEAVLKCTENLVTALEEQLSNELVKNHVSALEEILRKEAKMFFPGDKIPGNPKSAVRNHCLDNTTETNKIDAVGWEKSPNKVKSTTSGHGLETSWSTERIKQNKKPVASEAISVATATEPKCEQETLVSSTTTCTKTPSESKVSDELPRFVKDLECPTIQQSTDQLAPNTSFASNNHQEPTSILPGEISGPESMQSMVMKISSTRIGIATFNSSDINRSRTNYCSTIVSHTLDGTWIVENSYPKINQSAKQTWNLKEFLGTEQKTLSEITMINKKSFTVSVEFLLAVCIRWLLQNHFGGHVAPWNQHVIIAVPFWFLTDQRQMVITACKIAGICQTSLVNESSAAAYNFFMTGGTRKTDELVVISENAENVDISLYMFSHKIILHFHAGSYDKRHNVDSKILPLWLKYGRSRENHFDMKARSTLKTLWDSIKSNRERSCNNTFFKTRHLLIQCENTDFEKLFKLVSEDMSFSGNFVCVKHDATLIGLCQIVSCSTSTICKYTEGIFSDLVSSAAHILRSGSNSAVPDKVFKTDKNGVIFCTMHDNAYNAEKKYSVYQNCVGFKSFIGTLGLKKTPNKSNKFMFSFSVGSNGIMNFDCNAKAQEVHLFVHKSAAENLSDKNVRRLPVGLDLEIVQKYVAEINLVQIGGFVAETALMHVSKSVMESENKITRNKMLSFVGTQQAEKSTDVDIVQSELHLQSRS